MKKLLQTFSLALLSSSILAQTQVPNADFENWTLYKPNYNYYAASNWSNGAACASVNGGTEQCQFVNRRTTDAQSGTYAIQYFDLKPAFGPNINTLPFWNVNSNFTTPAFTGRPTSVSFYYKYDTDDNQPMIINFKLYSGSLSNPTDIGSATFEFSADQSTYKKVDLVFDYVSSSAPTNIYIDCDFPDDSKPTTAFDTLTWDNIVFNYVATDVTDKSSPDYFTVSTINKNLTTSREINTVKILDYTGREVANFDNASTNFNLAQLKTGIYILTGTINENPFSRKIIIE